MRTFHVDEKAGKILATDHPTVRAHLVRSGRLVVPAPVARHMTMTPGTHPDARGYAVQLVNANWTG